MNVWGEESPAIGALGSPKSSRQRHSSEKKALPEKENLVPEVQTDHTNVPVPSTVNDLVASEPSSASPDIPSVFENGKNKG